MGKISRLRLVQRPDAVPAAGAGRVNADELEALCGAAGGNPGKKPAEGVPVPGRLPEPEKKG